MTREQFESLVAEALDALPAEFAMHLQNVAILIEDEPTPEALRAVGLDPHRDTLFGLYQGVPLDQRSAVFGNALPDTITLFYRPLVRSFRSPERIAREIRATVVHEVAHFFGLGDEEIRRLGY